MFSLDDDIATLSNSESDHIGLVWLDRNEVVSYDRHSVVINRESLNGFRASINKSEAVFLPFGKLEFSETGIRRAWQKLARRKGLEGHQSTDKPGHSSRASSHSSFFR